MAAKGIVSILAGFFNQGDGKRPLPQFRDELKELTDDEKMELALGVCAITGDTVTAGK